MNKSSGLRGDDRNFQLPSRYISPHLVARHIPQSVSDLAVNVKKVEEVRHWLRDRLGKRGMLVLTGPAGDLLLTLVHVSLTA